MNFNTKINITLADYKFLLKKTRIYTATNNIGTPSPTPNITDFPFTYANQRKPITYEKFYHTIKILRSDYLRAFV